MIRIIDDQTKRFIDFLNQNYGTEAECIVSVFNCQDSVCVSEDGKEEQSLFIPEADLVMLTTEKPANGIFDSAGNPAPKFYEDNCGAIPDYNQYGVGRSFASRDNARNHIRAKEFVGDFTADRLLLARDTIYGVCGRRNRPLFIELPSARRHEKKGRYKPKDYGF